MHVRKSYENVILPTLNACPTATYEVDLCNFLAFHLATLHDAVTTTTTTTDEECSENNETDNDDNNDMISMINHHNHNNIV